MQNRDAIARKTLERIKIYSVLKSHDMKLSEASLWNVTESVVEESAKHSLDPMLVLAVMKVESRFDHRAVSPQGALGLMQIRPIVVDELVDEGEIPEWKSKNKPQGSDSQYHDWSSLFELPQKDVQPFAFRSGRV